MPNNNLAKLEVYAPKEAIQTRDTLSRNALITVLVFAKLAYNNPELEEYSLPVSKIYELFGHKTTEYKLVKSTLKELTSSSIEWSMFDKEGHEKINFAVWCSESNIYKGIITFTFPKSLKQLLINADKVRHATLSLPIITQLKSRYSIKIYQECLLHYNHQKKYGETPYRKIEEFKNYLGVDGETYNEFKRLNNRILKPSLKEINKKTGFLITAQFQKIGKTITAIKLTVKPNPNDPLKDLNLDNLNTSPAREEADKKPESQPISPEAKAKIEAFKKARAERKSKNPNIKKDRGLNPLDFGITK